MPSPRPSMDCLPPKHCRKTERSTIHASDFNCVWSPSRHLRAAAASPAPSVTTVRCPDEGTCGPRSPGIGDPSGRPGRRGLGVPSNRLSAPPGPAGSMRNPSASDTRSAATGGETGPPKFFARPASVMTSISPVAKRRQPRAIASGCGPAAGVRLRRAAPTDLSRSSAWHLAFHALQSTNALDNDENGTLIGVRGFFGKFRGFRESLRPTCKT